MRWLQHTCYLASADQPMGMNAVKNISVKEGGRTGSLEQDTMSRTELLMRTLRGCTKISGLNKVSWSEKDNKKTGTHTIWYNRREDGKHQQGVIFARESQTVKALIKIILSIRWYTLIYVLGKEEHLLCKGCATQAAEVGLVPGMWEALASLWGRVMWKQGSLVDLEGYTFQCEKRRC